jgi:hypothetical protein
MSRFANLTAITPDTDAAPSPDTDQIDAIGKRHGFKSREAQDRLYKLNPTHEATVPLSIRPPLSVANRFIAWCKANRLSYWEGLNELMTHRGI